MSHDWLDAQRYTCFADKIYNQKPENTGKSTWVEGIWWCEDTTEFKYLKKSEVFAVVLLTMLWFKSLVAFCLLFAAFNGK